MIRKYDSYYHFSDETSHNTAIECMDILSKLVNDKVNSTKLAYTIDEAEEISDKGFTHIFSVSEFLEKEDPFESGDVIVVDKVQA